MVALLPYNATIKNEEHYEKIILLFSIICLNGYNSLWRCY